VAYDIDNIKQTSFLGTVAGDDTVIVVLAEGTDREEAGKIVRDMFPKLN
jgi:transcriptional regulator of arginine metabolism